MDTKLNNIILEMKQSTPPSSHLIDPEQIIHRAKRRQKIKILSLSLFLATLSISVLNLFSLHERTHQEELYALLVTEMVYEQEFIPNM